MKTIRLGIVGAGANTREKHIPGFRKFKNVKIVGVANSTLASSRKAAAELGIPKAYDDWVDLVEDTDIDAICIGTWPNMHEPIAVAALESNKHVLCEARMAASLEDALSMYSASLQYPHLIAQVVPAPFTLTVDQQISAYIADETIGRLLSVDVIAEVPQGTLATWRQKTRFSGQNIMTLGIWYEAIMRWVGCAQTVIAISRLVYPMRKTEQETFPVDVPDYLEVMGELIHGAVYHLRLSSAGAFARNEVTLTGTKGIIRFNNGVLSLQKSTDKEPHVIKPKGIGWNVEADFIESILNNKPVSHTTFYDGVRYMAFTEAVHTSLSRREAQSVEVY